MSSFRRAPMSPLHRMLFSCFFLVATLLSACGGGSNSTASASPGTGGTGSFTTGPISGFGSVIINNVRYADSGALVQTEDGDSTDDDKGELDLDDLKLGMIASVVAGKETPASTSSGLASAQASIFYLSNELKGPVSAIDLAKNTLTVLQQTIRTTNTTVFGNVANLAQANVAGNCQYADIYAYYNTSDNSYTATRVECSATTPPSFRIFGPASLVSSTSFAINGLTIMQGSTTLSGITAGVSVRVQLSTLLTGSNNQVATALRLRTRTPSSIQEFNESEGEATAQGLIDSYTSDAQFSVNGIPVVTTASTAFASGLPRPLAAGLWVEAEGDFANGTLMAREIEPIETTDSTDTSKFIGRVSNASGNAGGTFTLTTSSRQSKVFTVTYTTADFEEASDRRDFANGATIEVKGKLAANGIDLDATSIEVED